MTLKLDKLFTVLNRSSESGIPMLSLNTGIKNAVNTYEENLTMDIASVRILFWLRPWDINIIRGLDMKFHFYADDSQVYFSFDCFVHHCERIVLKKLLLTLKT